MMPSSVRHELGGRDHGDADRIPTIKGSCFSLDRSIELSKFKQAHRAVLWYVDSVKLESKEAQVTQNVIGIGSEDALAWIRLLTVSSDGFAADLTRHVVHELREQGGGGRFILVAFLVIGFPKGRDHGLEAVIALGISPRDAIKKHGDASTELVDAEATGHLAKDNIIRMQERWPFRLALAPWTPMVIHHLGGLKRGRLVAARDQ
tara:strand:- start:532 stop:1146 length:615 start_codon:yes stop_codon:yes gene_type:complete